MILVTGATGTIGRELVRHLDDGDAPTRVLVRDPARAEGLPARAERVIDPGRYAPIDPADIAAVAALVLTTDGHQGQAYDLTGGELLTVADQVRILAAATGRAIEARPAATPQEAVLARFPAGGPQPLTDALTEGYALMRAGAADYRTDTVRALLGRAPATFTDWCARNAAAFTP